MGLGVDGVKNAETRTRPELLQLLEPMFRVFIRRFYIVDFKFLWGFIGASVESVEPSITRVREILQGPIDAKRDELLKLPKESGKDHIEYWKKDVMERLLSPALKLAREEDVVFSEKEILDEIFSFYLAGYETTALATTISLYELCKHPDVQQRLREEIDRVYDPKHFELDTLNTFTYLDAVVKEIMRLHPVTPQITRIITNPLELDCDEGYKVLLPKGTEVIVNISMLHKNKALWGDDALEFRPERWLEGKVTTGMYYPFGGGHFVCLGQKLATIEIKLFLIRVLQRFEFKLADKFVPEFEYVGTCGIRSLSVDLRVRS
ncbi:hypothetical protein HK098_002577 [Nowakowskiella sp. JEL0407]|nr:hypothetical protein HK098_002577 [Nowakowskiella sp. JEL0407]